jgi:hypothetical protein
MSESWADLLARREWERVVAEAAGAADPHARAVELGDLWALAEAFLDGEDLAGARHAVSTHLAALDWAALVRAAGARRDPAARLQGVRELWSVVSTCVPPRHAEPLLRRLAALGTAARKKIDFLAAEAARGDLDAHDEVVGERTAGERGIDAPIDAPTALPARVPGPRPSRAPDGLQEVEWMTAALRRRDPAVTHEQAAAALGAWHDTVTVDGRPVHLARTPGLTGVTVLDLLVARYGSMAAPQRLRSELVWGLSTSPQVLRILSWVDPTATPRPDGQLLVETDVHGQYLAAAGSVALGDGEPTHVLDRDGLAGWDLAELVRCPGYVVVASPPDLGGLPPHIVGAFSSLAATTGGTTRRGTARRVRGGKSILPTPLAAYLVRDHGRSLDLDAAVVWHTRPDETGKARKAYGPRLKRWTATLREARAVLLARAEQGDEAAALALTMVKMVYTTALGGMLRSPRHNPGAALRPDWFDQVVGLAQANLLRALDKAWSAGWSPVGGMKDAVWWATPPGASSPEGLEISTQLGKWHHTRWCPVDERVVAAHGTGRAPHLRDALIAGDKHRKQQQQFDGGEAG